MAIKFADEIIEEIKNRQPAAVTDVSVNGDEYERWLYEEEKEKRIIIYIYEIKDRKMTNSSSLLKIDTGTI